MNQFTYPEGATPLIPEEQEGLKLKHITTRGELDRWEQENIQDALAWLERKRKFEVLEEAFLCQLHQKMFSKVWKWAGTFRRTNKNIGIHWTQVPLELRRLLDDTKAWIEFKSYSADEIAYRFHHRLVWIHLFPNGNGRHFRLMADVILGKILRQEAFSWRKGDLSSASEVRKKYIKALKAADQYEYKLLSEFVRS